MRRKESRKRARPVDGEGVPLDWDGLCLECGRQERGQGVPMREFVCSLCVQKMLKRKEGMESRPACPLEEVNE